MVAETDPPPVHRLVYPLFVTEEISGAVEIGSMPGQYRHSIPSLVREVREAFDLGLRAVILFGLPKTKDDEGTAALDPDGIVPRAIRAIRAEVPEMFVITDVCVDEYTTHGHCGRVRDGHVQNDETLTILAQMARVHARAGADMVAPSDMMDGRVGAIRRALDDAGYDQTPILSYAAKYASCFYAPFRDAAQSAPQFGDRKSYQMDPANRREAHREVALDRVEGADMVMVKPALPYLDVIAAVKGRFDLPVAAYQVSGEYAMIRAAGRLGWIDEAQAIDESLLSIRRAGADLILTYFAKEVARRFRLSSGT